MSNVHVLLTRKQVAAMCGLSMSTIKAYRRDGEMPEPDVVYERTPLWREATIRQWREGKTCHSVS